MNLPFQFSLKSLGVLGFLLLTLMSCGEDIKHQNIIFDKRPQVKRRSFTRAEIKERIFYLTCVEKKGDKDHKIVVSGVEDALLKVNRSQNEQEHVDYCGGLLDEAKSLQELDLSENELNSIDLLGVFRELRELNLENNFIKSVEPLQELAHLEVVNLKNNYLEKEKVKEDLKNIETLILD